MKGTSQQAPLIHERQNSPENLRVLAAARRRYQDRKRTHRWRVLGTLGVAAAGPIVLLLKPEAGPFLGALAGTWVFLARTVLAFLESRGVDEGRRMQEVFDCTVLGLPWNPALGRRPSGEAISAAAQRWGRPDRLQNWYPAEHLGCSPRDVLICQRSSVAWGERLHNEYAWVIGIGATLLWLTGIVVAVADRSTLSVYLTTIGLPSLPALLDAVDLVKSHREASQAKGGMEADMTNLLEKGSKVSLELCRDYQDRIYAQRGRDPVVADRYYWLRRDAYEQHMREAAERLLNQGA